MRHTTTTACAVLLLALTTGCGSSDDGDGEAASSPSTSPSASADPATAYLAAAQGIAFTGSQPTDTELTALPPKWCAGLDDGHSVEWLLSSGGGAAYPNGMDWGTLKRDAYTLVVAGVRAYCPTHTAAVTEELRATGQY